MYQDVVELQNFYRRTSLGAIARKHLCQVLQQYWPHMKGMTLVGFGFATPLLQPFQREAARVLGVMPAKQGVVRWPAEGRNATLLCSETSWPLPSGFVDRLIVAHGLESCEYPEKLLEEIWRVLAPEGKVIFIVTNRSGLWSRRDTTPFGSGRPYSTRQLEHLLNAHRFTVEQHRGALYGPPSHRKFWLRMAGMWEHLGQRVEATRLAGVIVVEATKLVYVPPIKKESRVSLDRLAGTIRPKLHPALGCIAPKPPTS